jgi:hypothetical protein
MEEKPVNLWRIPSAKRLMPLGECVLGAHGQAFSERDQIRWGG